MDKFGLAEVIDGIRDELAKAAASASGKDPKFLVDGVSVELEVVTERVTEGQAGLRFWVVEAGTRHERGTAHAHRVTVSLTPAKPLYTGDDHIPR